MDNAAFKRHVNRRAFWIGFVSAFDLSGQYSRRAWRNLHRDIKAQIRQRGEL